MIKGNSVRLHNFCFYFRICPHRFRNLFNCCGNHYIPFKELQFYFLYSCYFSFDSFYFVTYLRIPYRKPRYIFCKGYRSEEHTSELQSRGHLVCRLLLEKKNKKNNEILRDIRKEEENTEVSHKT